MEKSKSKIKNFTFSIVILLFVFCILNFMGCATLKEAAGGFAGISTKILEDNRGSAIKKSFDYDYFSSYTKTLDILRHIGCYIYAQSIKKHMIAVYVSSEDTTPVGVFFKETAKNSTQVEVSSPSTQAKELISLKVFSALGGSVKPEEGKGQLNAKKEMQDK